MRAQDGPHGGTSNRRSSTSTPAKPRSRSEGNSKRPVDKTLLGKHAHQKGNIRIKARHPLSRPSPEGGGMTSDSESSSQGEEEEEEIMLDGDDGDDDTIARAAYSRFRGLPDEPGGSGNASGRGYDSLNLANLTPPLIPAPPLSSTHHKKSSSSRRISSAHQQQKHRSSSQALIEEEEEIEEETTSSAGPVVELDFN